MKICIFCSYFEYKIPKYVRAYVRELSTHFDRTIFIFSRKNNSENIIMDGHNTEVIETENEGLDFGMWMKALNLINIKEIEYLCLANDSAVPFTKFDGMISDFTNSSHQLYGATQSNEISPHIQSYFMLLRHKAINVLRYLFKKNKILDNYNDIVNNYEIKLSNIVVKQGFTIGSFFPMKHNPSAYYVNELIEMGCPIIKRFHLNHEYKPNWTDLIQYMNSPFHIDTFIYSNKIDEKFKHSIIDIVNGIDIILGIKHKYYPRYNIFKQNIITPDIPIMYTEKNIKNIDSIKPSYKSLSVMCSYFESNLPEYVTYYTNELARHFDHTVFVFCRKTKEYDVKFDNTNITIIEVENEGLDFGMWMKALREFDLSETETLCLANDSCILIRPLDYIMEAHRISAADLYGMTSSPQIALHIQSYFLLFKKNAINCLKILFEKNGIVNSYNDVIRKYEIGLSQLILNYGFKIDTLYSPSVNTSALNPMKILNENGSLIKRFHINHNYKKGWPESKSLHRVDFTPQYILDKNDISTDVKRIIIDMMPKRNIPNISTANYSKSNYRRK